MSLHILQRGENSVRYRLEHTLAKSATIRQNWVNDLQFLTRILTFSRILLTKSETKKMYKESDPIFRCTTPSTRQRLGEVVVGTLSNNQLGRLVIAQWWSGSTNRNGQKWTRTRFGQKLSYSTSCWHFLFILHHWLHWCWKEETDTLVRQTVQQRNWLIFTLVAHSHNLPVFFGSIPKPYHVWRIPRGGSQPWPEGWCSLHWGDTDYLSCTKKKSTLSQIRIIWTNSSARFTKKTFSCDLHKITL